MNKIFLQEIKEKMQETEEEMVDAEADTREFIKFQEKSCETELGAFVVPAVDVERDGSKVKRTEFVDVIMKIANNEYVPDENEMKAYFDLEDLQNTSDSDNENEELLEVTDEAIAEISENLVIHLQIKNFFDNIHKINSKLFKDQAKKLKYYKNKRNAFTKHLKELRKTAYLAIKENNSLKLTISQMKTQPIRVRKYPSKLAKTEKKRKITVPQEFNIGRRPSRAVTQVPFDFTPVILIINKVTSGQLSEKLTISKKSFIKFINTFNNDFSSLYPEQNPIHSSLSNYFFSYIYSKFNNKKVVESNFAQYILACETYRSSSTIVWGFSRYLGIFDALELDYYLMFLDFCKILSEICKVNELICDENDEVFVSLIRCEEATNVYWKGKITESEKMDLLQKLKRLERPCPKHVNFCGVLNRSDLIEVNNSKLSQYLDRGKHNFKDLFDGGDLSGDNFLSHEEFDLLFKNIEKQIYTAFYSKLLFTTYSDLIAELNGEELLAISYNKFSFMCSEKGLFHLEAQNLFLGVKDNADLILALEDLQENADKRLGEIKWRYYKLGMSSSVQMNMLKMLVKQLKSKTEKRSVYVAYRILEEDSKEKLIEKALKEAFPFIVFAVEKANEHVGIDRHPPRREPRVVITEESEEEEWFDE